MTKRYCDICYKEICEQENYTELKITPKIKSNLREAQYIKESALELCDNCMNDIRKFISSKKSICKMGYRE